MDRDASFGRLLRRLRKARDLTQAALAQQVYCAADTIKKLEQGLRRPSRQLAAQLADGLDLAGDERTAFLALARAEPTIDPRDVPAEPIAHLSPEPPPSAMPSGTVTFLFTDIEGSTQLWEQHPAVMPAALVRHDAILRQAIEQHGGHIFKTVGDAVYAAFASAPDTLAAALDAQLALQHENWEPIEALQVRMVLHTGAVAAQAGDYYGPPLNRVSRLLTAGHGGQILLSRATMELVHDALPPDVTLRDLGERRLRDLSRPEYIFQVVAPDLPTDFPPLRALDLRPNNLPAQPNTLIGREHEVVAVRDMLRRAGVRLLTLTGPGGTGKTRLALQVVSELLDSFAHGVWFVNLAPIRDPTLVIPAIAQTLGLKESGGQSFMDSLKAYLREKQLLLLLDNFEQVVDAAVQVAELLAAAPGLKVLMTSRAVLHLSGEHGFTVPPLALPERQSVTDDLARLNQYEAVRLFIERAQAVKPDFVVTNDNAPAVAEICARLDGLPLAIELAAAWVRLFPPQALLARLANRLKLLTSGPLDVPTRHQALRNAIDWSYQLLDIAEQQLFVRLSVFVGGCTLEAAQAVCDTDRPLPIDVMDGVVSLVDKSLLKQVVGAGEPRFVMLETIREFALEQLDASGEEPALRRRHAIYYAALAEHAAPWLTHAERQPWLQRLGVEHTNLRAALAWGCEQVAQNQTALQLAGDLSWFWYFRGEWSEGRSWLEKVLAYGPMDGALGTRANALDGAGLLAWLQGDYVRAHIWLKESEALWRVLDRHSRLARTLSFLGFTALGEGNIAEACARFEESVALCHGTNDRWCLALSLYGLGDATKRTGDAAAWAVFEASLAIWREIGDAWGIALPLVTLGDLALQQGNYAMARTYEEEALLLLRESGEQSMTAWTLCNLGHIARHQEDDERAEAYFIEGLMIFQLLGHQPGRATILSNLGYLAFYRGDHAKAVALVRESLSLFRDLGHELDIALCLARLAEIAVAQQQPMRAAKLYGVVDQLYANGVSSLFSSDRASYERHIIMLRARLDTATFAAAWDEGHTLSLDQAIVEALNVAA